MPDSKPDRITLDPRTTDRAAVAGHRDGASAGRRDGSFSRKSGCPTARTTLPISGGEHTTLHAAAKFQGARFSVATAAGASTSLIFPSTGIGRRSKSRCPGAFRRNFRFVLSRTTASGSTIPMACRWSTSDFANITNFAILVNHSSNVLDRSCVGVTTADRATPRGETIPAAGFLFEEGTDNFTGDRFGLPQYSRQRRLDAFPHHGSPRNSGGQDPEQQVFRYRTRRDPDGPCDRGASGGQQRETHRLSNGSHGHRKRRHAGGHGYFRQRRQVRLHQQSVRGTGRQMFRPGRIS